MNIPYCPKCGSKILYRAKQEVYWTVRDMKISIGENGAGASLELGELDDTYSVDSDYVCSNEHGNCGDVVPLTDIVIREE